MSINRSIRKALFEVEKTAIFITSLIIVINLAVNGIVFLINSSTSSVYLLTQFVTNVLVFGFVYLMIYTINQIITATPFLVSLNCPRNVLAGNIIFTGITRSLVITLMIYLIKVTVIERVLGMNLYTTSIFGVNLGSSNITDLLILAGILSLLLYFVYSLVTLISLLGVRFGWKYVLTAIFIFLGLCFLSFRSIILLVVHGQSLTVFISILLILITVFNFLNYRLLVNFEYKY